MRTIGITGPTGAGKTTALEAVRSLGGVVFDCDQVYKGLLRSSKPMLSAIEARFPGVVRDGQLNRAELAGRVFADPAALRDLSDITHPYVISEVRRGLLEAEREGRRLAAIDAIALFESGADKLCGETVFITAPVETRVARVMARDGIDRDAALSRVLAQRDDGWFEERCDVKLVNNFPDSEGFFRRCREFFQEDEHGRDQR